MRVISTTNVLLSLCSRVYTITYLKRGYWIKWDGRKIHSGWYGQFFINEVNKHCSVKKYVQGEHSCKVKLGQILGHCIYWSVTWTWSMRLRLRYSQRALKWIAELFEQNYRGYCRTPLNEQTSFCLLSYAGAQTNRLRNTFYISVLQRQSQRQI